MVDELAQAVGALRAGQEANRDSINDLKDDVHEVRKAIVENGKQAALVAQKVDSLADVIKEHNAKDHAEHNDLKRAHATLDKKVDDNQKFVNRVSGALATLLFVFSLPFEWLSNFFGKH